MSYLEQKVRRYYYNTLPPDFKIGKNSHTKFYVHNRVVKPSLAREIVARAARHRKRPHAAKSYVQRAYEAKRRRFNLTNALKGGVKLVADRGSKIILKKFRQ
jgi:hypothetical protein